MTKPNSKLVLIVDDDESIRLVMRMALELEGYRVTTAVNGQDALEKIHLVTPDLVLLDMMMPILNGRGFLDAISKEPAFATLPILVISAAVFKEKIQGAVDCIKKPIDLNLLFKLVEQYSGPINLKAG